MSFSASVKAGVTLVQMKMTDRKRKKKKQPHTKSTKKHHKEEKSGDFQTPTGRDENSSAANCSGDNAH